MAKYIAFKKINTKNGIKRIPISSGSSKSVRKFISSQKRAGQFTSGNYVAFRIVKNKKAFKINNVPVAKKGTPFKF